MTRSTGFPAALAASLEVPNATSYRVGDQVKIIDKKLTRQ